MEEWRRKKIENVYAKWEKNAPRRERDKPVLNGHVKPKGPLVIRASRGSNGRTGSWKRRQDLPEQQMFLPSLGIDPNDLHAASHIKYISMRYSCPRCLPASKAQFSPADGTQLGLFDFLVIDKRKYGVFGRLFPYLTHSWSMPIDYCMKDLRKESFKSKRVSDAVQKCAQAAAENDLVEYGVALKKQEQRAAKIIQDMSSSVYIHLARLVAWALLNVFRRLFNRIQVSKTHMAMLTKAQERGVPIVFLPGHKSHMDYIIMTFILFNMGVHIPRIAAGDNLKIPLISWLVTHLGGFFIKRKLDTSTGKDIVYRKCLQEFMVQSLSNGENMEFFIEGSRSRSGKPNSPKAGLLSVLVDAVKEGVVEDILLVPVGISYDVLVERNFVRHELMGGSKRPETLCQALRGVWTMLTRNTGSIRVDFAQPFSLQEYISQSTIADHSQLELTNAAHYRSILNISDMAQRKVVTSLSQHLVHDITHCASLMPTSMVAFLLLTKHREGVTVNDLVTGYQWLEEVADKKQRSLGFAGTASEAVHYALHYLAPLLTSNLASSRQNGRISCDQEVCPRLQLPDVFQLLHHANQVTPMLVLEAVVACSIHCIVGKELRLGHCEGSDVVEVSKDEVVDAATFLCRVLAREFIFAPPCLDVWGVLNDTVDSLVNSDILRIPSEQAPADAIPGRKLPYLFGDSEDEEDDCSSVRLQVNSKPWALEQLGFFQSMLNPFLEGYWNTAVALLQMETVMEETDFLKQLQETLLDKAEKGLLRNLESCSMDTLRNAVKSMLDLGYIGYKNGSQIYLLDSNRLLEVVEKITDFKT